MMTKYDVIVIGAGPAGSTASAVLAENGINTLLIEKEKLPRAKICGGAVSKRALSILESANIKIPKLKTFKKCNSMQLGTFDFDLVENLANIKFDKEAAYLTDRDEFDYAIVQDAIFKGAELKQNSRVKNIKKEKIGKHETEFFSNSDNLTNGVVSSNIIAFLNPLRAVTMKIRASNSNE